MITRRDASAQPGPTRLSLYGLLITAPRPNLQIAPGWPLDYEALSRVDDGVTSPPLSRQSQEVQLAVVGKGDKPRHVLLPAHLAELLQTMRVGQKPSARVFPLTERRINYIVKAAAKRAGVNPAVSVHWLRHAHASHAIDAGAPITLVSQTLGHADLKTTSVYAHAKPDDCSSRYLKRTMR